MKRAQQGFTLVEIAIVLVIIGLLLGGMLKGQEMITQARIKNVVGDFSSVSAAYLGFQDRYRALPGDDGGAAARWANAPAAVSGNANGQVAGSYNADCAGATPPETCQWWDHLRRAGFLSGSGARQPNNTLGGLLGVQVGDAGATIGPVLGADAAGTGGFSGLILCSANLPDKIALAVDSQLDDGVPSTGSVRAALQSEPNPAVAKQAAAAYEESGSNQYLVCRTL
jgi:prepilin-type N-terminal cleavage/methylation domain-containing protein